MSGFEDNAWEDKIFVNIVAGRLAVKAKEGELGATGKPAVSRVITNKETKEERTVWEHLYPKLRGTLLHVDIQKNEKLNAYQYLVDIQNGIEVYRLSIPADSKYGDNFASKLPNLKKGEYTLFSPYDFEDKEKLNRFNGKPLRQTGITLLQNEVKVAAYFTNDTPNGRPVGAKQMDEDDWKVYMIQVRKFYRGVVEKWNTDNTTTMPDKKSTSSAFEDYTGPVNKAVAKKESEWEEEVNDDLPF